MAALTRLDEARLAVLGALGGGTAAEPTMPAIERYAGVLYRGLDWPSLPADARRRGRRVLLTVSGLWGRWPRRSIPYYKLKMSASLPGLGRLSTWWRPHLTAALARAPETHRLGPATGRARRRVDAGRRRRPRRYVVRFVDADGRTVSHWNKLLKGALVRRLLVGTGLGSPWRRAGGTRPVTGSTGGPRTSTPTPVVVFSLRDRREPAGRADDSAPDRESHSE